MVQAGKEVFLQDVTLFGPNDLPLMIRSLKYFSFRFSSEILN